MMSHLHLAAATPLCSRLSWKEFQRIEGGGVGTAGRGGMTYLSVPASGSLCLEGGPQTILVWAQGGSRGLGWPLE